MSLLDQVFRGLLLTKFFNKGWGRPEDLKRIFEFRKIISDREQCQKLVKMNYPVHITKDETQKEVKIVEGHFVSPLYEHLPHLVPEEVKTARFQFILPASWDKTEQKWGENMKPLCLHLGGTGDHGFKRRRSIVARPLLKETGISSLILENPYYGCRKPKQQVRSCLQNVSDLFVMGGALILESIVLFRWCEQNGYGPLGITGISMGGFMASLAASSWPKPISLIPCLSWSTASTVFTKGVLSGAIDWKLLQEQITSDKMYGGEVASLIHSPEKSSAFHLGVEFAKNDATEYDFDIYRDNYNSLVDVDHEDNNSAAMSKQQTNKWYSTHETNSTSIKSGRHKKKKQSMNYHTSSYFSQGVHKCQSYASGQKSSHNTNRNISKRILKQFKLNKRSKATEKEAVDFMNGVMDECTHLGNFPVPVDPNLVIIVVASDDAYVPTDNVINLCDMWNGAQLRRVKSGHIGAFLTKQPTIRKAICDSFELQLEKYYKQSFKK